MSRENDAPPPTPQETMPEVSINEYFPICHNCSSSIEILSINDKNNSIKYRCIKENKEYLISINEYLEKIKGFKKKNIYELKDKCEEHKNNNYISYCYECNCHLCNECLKKGKHINHKKSNMLEIKPLEEEITIIKKVIKDYNERLEKIKKEKEEKTKEKKYELEKKIKNEEKKLENIKKENKKKEEKEIKEKEKEYIKEIEEIKKRYENEIKEARNKYKDEKKNTNNKYKLIIEEEKIKNKIIM